MVKHVTSDPLSDIALERRTQFLHDYGSLLALWSEFELALEVKIAELAGMEPAKASIVLGALSFGNKPAILYSLLEQAEQPDSIPKVRAVINAARRNALVHSIVATEDEMSEIVFVKREVGASYKVSETRFTADSFNEHFMQFRLLYAQAMVALNINLQDLEEYGRRAQFFRQD